MNRNKKKPLIIATSAVFMILVLLILKMVVIPYVTYSRGESLMTKENYTEAAATFKQIEGYKDSADKVKLCYEKAVDKYLKEGNYKEALLLIRKTADSKEEAEKVKNFKVIYDKKVIHNESGDTVVSYKYDKNGNCIEEKTEYSDGTLYTSLYEYDKDGNCIKITGLDENGDATSVTEYFYDSKGICTKKTSEVFANNIKKTEEYIYDNNGRIIEAAGGGSSSKYYYDADGNLARKEYSSGGKELYEYDKDGNLKEKITITEDGKKETVFTAYTKFDEKNVEICTDFNGKKKTYEFQRDEFGNEKEVKITDDNTSKIIRRSYTYTGIKVSYKK